MTRICAEPGCPNPTDNTRCKLHESKRNRQRGTTTQRGYGTQHQQLRNQLLTRQQNGETLHCWRCHTPLGPTWDLGHDDNNRNKHRGPECQPCNRATRQRTPGG